MSIETLANVSPRSAPSRFTSRRTCGGAGEKRQLQMIGGLPQLTLLTAPLSSSEEVLRGGRALLVAPLMFKELVSQASRRRHSYGCLILLTLRGCCCRHGTDGTVTEDIANHDRAVRPLKSNYALVG